MDHFVPNEGRFLCSFLKYFGSILDFEGAKEKNIGPELDELLSHIAKTGRTEYDRQYF